MRIFGWVIISRWLCNFSFFPFPHYLSWEVFTCIYIYHSKKLLLSVPYHRLDVPWVIGSNCFIKSITVCTDILLPTFCWTDFHSKHVLHVFFFFTNNFIRHPSVQLPGNTYFHFLHHQRARYLHIMFLQSWIFNTVAYNCNSKACDIIKLQILPKGKTLAHHCRDLGWISCSGLVEHSNQYNWQSSQEGSHWSYSPALEKKRLATPCVCV